MYIAIRSFKVQNDAGETRLVKPGDKIPEALAWRNAKAYVNRDWVRWDDGTAPPVHAKPSPPASVTIEKPSPPPAPEPEPETSSDYTETELNRMSKKELQELAESLDLDTDQNKADLVYCLPETQ